MPQTLKRYLPASLCGLSVVICELIARPYAAMGFFDDGPYILMARTLAATGHVVYNGWGAALMLAQLYLAAAFIKLFGFSFTTVRMSTLMIGVLVAFLLQRTLVHAGITERNATISTLAIVLSPLYLLLSVTFMSDIMGLFAIVLCLYGCIHALQSGTDGSAICWLVFAVATNVAIGTSRQISWLGTLVMVPSALWLLRERHRVLLAGVTFNLAGIGVILACLQWFNRQRYIIPVPLFTGHYPWAEAVSQLTFFLLDIPFLLLPIAALFLPQLRSRRPYVLMVVSVLALSFFAAATYPTYLRPYLNPALEPTSGAGSLLNKLAVIGVLASRWPPPRFLIEVTEAILTIVCIGGLLGLLISLLRIRQYRSVLKIPSCASWKQLALLFVPFFTAYCLLVVSASCTTHAIYDRYALGLLPLLVICAVRYYQEQITPRLPRTCIALVCIMGVFGIAATQQTFAIRRARVALAAKLLAKGIPMTAIDAGWEYNLGLELRYADHLNHPLLKTAANGYVPRAPQPGGLCQLDLYEYFPHIHPIYTFSFNPNSCYGPTAFAPVHYARWPFLKPGTLYVVRFTPSSKP